MKKNQIFKENILYYPVALLLIIKIPAIAIIIYLTRFILFNRKNDMFVLSLSFAMIAFYWNPYIRGDLYDLTRHHTLYKMLSSVGINEMMSNLTLFKPIQYLLVWSLGVFKNENTLQLTITLITMVLLLDILRYISMSYTRFQRFILVLYVFANFRFLMLFSNLWMDLAIVLMCYAFMRVKNISMRYLLSILSIGIHFSLIIPFVILLAIDIYFRYKLNIKKVIPYLLCFLIILSILIISGFISNETYIIEVIIQRFEAYSNDSLLNMNIYNIRYYLLEMTKPLFVAYLIFYSMYLEKKDPKLISLKGNGTLYYGILICFFTLIFGLKFVVLFRFSFMAVLFLSPSFIDILSVKNTISGKIKLNTQVINYIFLYMFISIHLSYQINSLYHADFFEYILK